MPARGSAERPTGSGAERPAQTGKLEAPKPAESSSALNTGSRPGRRTHRHPQWEVEAGIGSSHKPSS